MKKIKITLLTATILVSNSALAEKADKMYVSIRGEVVTKTTTDSSGPATPGVIYSSDDLDTGFGIGASAGYFIDNNIRTEAELSYRRTSDLDLYSLMGNAYVHLPIKGKLSPYIGGGLGVAYSDSGAIDSDATLAYQAMAGVDYSISEKGTLFGGYRYFGTTDFTAKDSIGSYDIDVEQHIIEVGYRFTF